jgi:hypothetical protein
MAAMRFPSSSIRSAPVSAVGDGGDHYAAALDGAIAGFRHGLLGALVCVIAVRRFLIGQRAASLAMISSAPSRWRADLAVGAIVLAAAAL